MPEYEYTFVLDGISLDDDTAVQSLTEELDALVSSFHGVPRMTVTGEGPDAVSAAKTVAARARGLVPGLRVLRLDRDLVGVADIAERAGRSRQNVTQWVHGQRQDGVPFPAPEGTAGRALVWLWTEVNEWLRGLGLDDGENRPTRAQMAQIDWMLLQEAYTIRLSLNLGTERDGIQHSARRLEEHARTTPQFIDFLLHHPEVRDANGHYTIVVCRPDDAAGDLFRRLGAYGHPVILAMVETGVYARVITPGTGERGAEPVELDPGATVRDWLGLMRLYPDRTFALAADGKLGAAPEGRPLELATA